jgi:hypothetical protein
MRYIDTGSRDPTHALATWLQRFLEPVVTEIRWQSGFFNAEPLRQLAPILQQFAQTNRLVHALIGSNPPGTQGDAVVQLVQVLGLPRTNVRLGVVQYAKGFYHPKTIDLRRNDGSQCAYVGSANLTGPGVSSLHVEAGITLDTNDGDSASVLEEIAASVDAWFNENRRGLHVVCNVADVHQLIDEGVLIVPPPPEPSAPPAIAGSEDDSDTGAGDGRSSAAPRLRPLINLPAIPPVPPSVVSPPATLPATVSPISAQAPAIPNPIPAIPVVTQIPFPTHLLFAPGVTTPTMTTLTVGVQALSGRPLAGGTVGAVIRLSGDTTRFFVAEEGTANLSLPTRTIETLRFGLQGRGKYPHRPRAEYDLMVRYIGSSTVTLDEPAETNVMPYGYLQGEVGNKDIRMLIPGAVRGLIPHIQRAGMPLPTDGDFALLEWPTGADPTFRLTFLQPGVPLTLQAQQLFTSAANAGQLLGGNGCSLPAGISPSW